MRIVPPGQKRNPETEGLMISIAGHLVFFSLFVFTFTLQPIAPKPVLVFLGSFFDPSEMTHIPSESTAPGIPRQKKTVTVETKRSTFVPTESSGLWKPTFSHDVRKGKRIYLKSTFLEEPKEENPEQLLKELGINQDLPPYRPLGMH